MNCCETTFKSTEGADAAAGAATTSVLTSTFYSSTAVADYPCLDCCWLCFYYYL